METENASLSTFDKAESGGDEAKSSCLGAEAVNPEVAGAMFNACVAASHSWQWHFSMVLAKQQLILLETLLRKPKRYTVSRRRSKKRIVTQWTSAEQTSKSQCSETTPTFLEPRGAF